MISQFGEICTHYKHCEHENKLYSIRDIKNSLFSYNVGYGLAKYVPSKFMIRMHI